MGGRKGIRLYKIEWWGAGVVVCLERGADLHMAQLMPLPLTVSCFSKILFGFTFLVPAHLGSPEKRAIKWVCVCVCVMELQFVGVDSSGPEESCIRWGPGSHYKKGHLWGNIRGYSQVCRRSTYLMLFARGSSNVESGYQY